MVLLVFKCYKGVTKSKKTLVETGARLLTTKVEIETFINSF